MTKILDEIRGMTAQEFADAFCEVPSTPMMKLRVGISCARDCLQRAKDGVPERVQNLRSIDYTYRQIVRAKAYVDKLLASIEKAAENGILADEAAGNLGVAHEENKGIISEWKALQ